jgi:hypothetical protein
MFARPFSKRGVPEPPRVDFTLFSPVATCNKLPE